MKCAIVLLCAILATATLARADEQPTNTGPLTPSEQSFVDAVRTDLLQRFPRVTMRKRPGTYVIPASTTPVRPATLTVIGTPIRRIPASSGTMSRVIYWAPIFPCCARTKKRVRFYGASTPDAGTKFNGHVHYTFVNPSSKKTIYDQWVWNDDFTAAGGSLRDPSAETLVKIGRISSATDVGTIFEFPTIWDLVVWVRPHSAGLLHW